MLLLLLWACDSDVSIIKRIEEETGQIVGIDEPGEPAAVLNQPTSEVGSQPSYEPSTDENIDQTRSGVTGLSTMYLRQIACPPCMGQTQELTLEYELKVHQPISDSWNSWGLSDGVCTEYLYQGVPSTQPIQVGQTIQITNENHQFQAYQSGTGLYYSQNIWESHLQRNSTYNVQTNEGSFNFVTIEGFDYIEPYTMLWVDPSYAFEAAVRRSGFTITWSPARASSRMMITLGIYSSDSYMETIQIWEVVGTGHIE
jgi:hypothetical protein